MTTPHQDPQPPSVLRPSDLVGLLLVAAGIALGVAASWLVDYRLGMGVLAVALTVTGAILGYERSR